MLEDFEVGIKASLKSKIETPAERKSSKSDDQGNKPVVMEPKNVMANEGAILRSVIVSAAVERGLEALIKAFEAQESGDDAEDMRLMDNCERNPGKVAEEMESAMTGMRKVLRYSEKGE